ncbi:MAG: hypothetical protein R2867_38860 [Caldilineaceae bacterium]
MRPGQATMFYVLYLTTSRSGMTEWAMAGVGLIASDYPDLYADPTEGLESVVYYERESLVPTGRLANDHTHLPRLSRLLTRAVQVLVTYLGLLLVASSLVPPLWMLTTAFKPLPDIFKIPPVWLPVRCSGNSYGSRGSSVISPSTLAIRCTAPLSVVGEVLVSSLVAYAFARLVRGPAAISFSC